MNTFWKKMTALMLGSVMVLSQGMAACAQEQPEEGAGLDVIVEDDAMPQQGAGLGLNTPHVLNVKREGLAGAIGMGSGENLNFDTEAYGAGESSDTDTTVLEDLQLTFQVQGPFMLVNAEDENFYYIYTWGEEGIPDIMVGSFDWNTTDGFFDAYTDYLSGGRPDLTIAEDAAEVTVGGKTLQRIVYNYGIQGYTIRDTRYIWLGSNGVLYMFTKREIPDIQYTLGNTLEDIIASAQVLGAQDTQIVEMPQLSDPAPTTGTQQTSDPAPTVESPQPSDGTGSSGGSLYVMNEDSSWTVTTDYYTMTIPPAWTGHFDASILTPYDSGYNLRVVNKESAEANFGGHLFTVMLCPQSEDYTILPSYDYLGTMATPEGTFNVVIEYPTDLQTGDVWTEFYKILNGDKNTAITSIRPSSGVVWTLPDGQTISGEGGASPAPAGNGTGQTETTVETPTPPETTTVDTPAPPAATTVSGGDVLGTADGTSYTNGKFGFNFHAPNGWILASKEQLVTLNEGLSADQFTSSIENGIPVCVAYAQSADGMEIMNVVVENGAGFMDPSKTFTQEDIGAILREASSVSTASLESLGATVTGASVNTVNCMGQTCYSLDITFDYAGYSGTQKQIGIPAGTYLAMVTVRSVSGDSTQAMLDMFSAA